MAGIGNKSGYSLFELIIVIVIVGILTSVTLRTLRSANDTARTEETRRELDQLAWAIAGNPELKSGGVRTDFGYIGDVGGLPSSLSMLVSNPGGYATWDGPYVLDDFYPDVISASSEYQLDAWGKPYVYAGGNTITSTGSGSSITRQIAGSINDLLYNSVSIAVTDLNHTPPGGTYRDSVIVVLQYPDGSGSMSVNAKTPRADGFVQFDSIPIGIHRLQVIYLPRSDTLTRQIVINPGQNYYSEIVLASDLW